MLNVDVQQPDDEKQPTADEISRVSKDYMSALSGTGPHVQRDPGLLITNEDVRSIRRYVNAGLELPVELNQVRQLLGDYDSSIDGLEPEAIQVLYQALNSHAKKWSPIESEMKQVGSDLKVFSGNLIVTAQAIVSFITGLESYQTRQVGNLTPEEIDQLPEVELVPGDKERIPALLSLVNDLKEYIQRYSTSTTEVKKSISGFKKDLKDELAPSVGLKIKLASSSGASGRIVQLNAQVASLNERINQKVEEYDEYSQYRWIGFWWGPIGGAISLSIYGPKAAAARKEKDRLIEEKRTLEQEILRLNRLLSSLLGLETSLQDLKIRIDGASGSASNLESLWILMKDLVDSSHDRLETVTNAMYLVSFVSRFKTVISNWTDIQKQAGDLLTAFNQVLEESLEEPSMS